MINDGINREETNVSSFLMIGQSNMAGRGDINDVYPIKNPLCFMLRNGRWQPMSEPINPDRSIFSGRYRSGISLAASFADEYAKKYGSPVGLIPCADGGTRIDQWMPGELLFDHAVMQARLAMRTSTLKGILFHQGESDCGNMELVGAYKERLKTVLCALRRELGMPKLPIMIGELYRYYSPDVFGFGDRPPMINAILREVANETEHSAFISSEGLSLKEDRLHFNSESLREFGVRYFEGYENIVK